MPSNIDIVSKVFVSLQVSLRPVNLMENSEKALNLMSLLCVISYF